MATTRKILMALCMTLTAFVLLATTVAAQMPQTSTEKIKGAGAVTTKQLKGEVVYVEGNDLVVKMASGAIKTFRVPEERKFIIDGKELSVHELKPGTKLTATVTTTTTPVTVRTTTVGSGKVWYAAGNNVILTLPNGENKQYIVKDDVKFMVNGSPATVFELRKGMTVSAEKIVEEPKVEVATDSQVVGHAPSMTAPAKVPAKMTSAAPQAPAPTSEAAAAPAAPAKAKLPKTASPLPLVGLLGLLSVAASLGLRNAPPFVVVGGERAALTVRSHHPSAQGGTTGAGGPVPAEPTERYT